MAGAGKCRCVAEARESVGRAGEEGSGVAGRVGGLFAVREWRRRVRGSGVVMVVVGDGEGRAGVICAKFSDLYIGI
jgi:hypothetical protein